MKFIKIKPSDTSVDHRFQRDLEMSRAEAMALAYDSTLFGVPVVSKRPDGSYFIIDGQHRIAANIKHGLGDVPVMMEVHEGLSEEEEAELFHRLNKTRKGVRALSQFKTRIFYKEPIAKDIEATLKRVGCKVTTSPQQNGVMAVTAIEAAYHKGTLERVMKALASWLDGDPSAFDGKLISAVSAFFMACTDADPEHLASRLEYYAPKKLMALLRRESQITASSRAEAARLVLIDIYNRRTVRTKRVA